MSYSRKLSADHNVTPEDRAIVKSVGKLLQNRNHTPRHVREAGLKIWMRQVAAYLAIEGSGHTRMEQLKTVRRIAREAVSLATYKTLLARPDFQELLERFAQDQIAATREQFQSMLPKVRESIEWSIDKAREKEDYKAIPGVVEPVLTRTIPKKDETVERSPVIIVNLGGTFAKQYVETTGHEVEVEELPPAGTDQSNS